MIGANREKIYDFFVKKLLSFCDVKSNTLTYKIFFSKGGISWFFWLFLRFHRLSVWMVLKILNKKNKKNKVFTLFKGFIFKFRNFLFIYKFDLWKNEN